MSKETKLNDKQEMFINEYLKCFNATRAAKNAGYSEKTAYSIGHDLLKHPEIASRVQARMKEATMSADEVLYHLAQIARGDIDDLLDNHGNLDLSKARELGKTNLIRKVKSRSITSENSDIFEAETEGYDRMRALELIGKHLAMFTDKTEIVTWETRMLDDYRAGTLTFAQVLGVYEGDMSVVSDVFKRAGLQLPANVVTVERE